MFSQLKRANTEHIFGFDQIGYGRKCGTINNKTVVKGTFWSSLHFGVLFLILTLSLHCHFLKWSRLLFGHILWIFNSLVIYSVVFFIIFCKKKKKVFFFFFLNQNDLSAYNTGVIQPGAIQYVANLTLFIMTLKKENERNSFMIKRVA